MSDLQFLDLERAREAGLRWPDVYFSPSYGQAVEASDGATWEVAVAEKGAIVFPYLKRVIPRDLAGARSSFDVVSPYGYAGTHVQPGVPLARVQAFRRELRTALRDRGAVAEFQRMSSLVPGRELVLQADAELHGERLADTIAIDVSGEYQVAWEAAQGRSRTKTRKARRLGYEARIRPTIAQDLQAGGGFRKLYDATMRRVGAREYYLFPDEYYGRLLEGLGDRLWTVEVVTPAAGEVGAAGIFMCWPPLLHLHLVGSDPSSSRDGAGNLLYDAVIAWGAGHADFERLHVGGGMQANDRLFKFKRSFGGREVPFWVARSVLDPERYRELLARRSEEVGTPESKLLESGYFPAYRAG